MPHQAAAHAFSRLVEIMAVLRSPEGCPWDREQTIDSLKPYVLEETYEMLEAIDRHDHHGLCEELGDFMELGKVRRDDGAVRVRPRPLADPVARVDGASTLRAQVGVPCAPSTSSPTG